ncbi:MAG TPA: hypothetical protein PKO06_11350 [Candidatus Ozemobacteraceae bacterium]|nr:hypothetical protein [Candidatus Ozemobacteraceae bacterium]
MDHSPDAASLLDQITEHIRQYLKHARVSGTAIDPAALIMSVENTLGWEARWLVPDAVKNLLCDSDSGQLFPTGQRAALCAESLRKALHGSEVPSRETQRTIDALFHRSKQFSTTAEFQRVITFMGRFREYAPFNNLLVLVQRPTCSFYATERDWWKRFRRTITATATPMVILAPMHPVLLVYDVNSTEGPPLPKELGAVHAVRGQPDPKIWSRLVRNCYRHGIMVTLQPFSEGKSGFTRRSRNSKFKIVVSLDKKAEPAKRLAILCHEIAHVLLGHVGGDSDGWWPNRPELTHAAVEIEAEATAFIVCETIGIETSSEKFLALKSRDLPEVPAEVSIELIAKVAGHIKEMCTRLLPPPKVRQKKPETSEPSRAPG